MVVFGGWDQRGTDPRAATAHPRRFSVFLNRRQTFLRSQCALESAMDIVVASVSQVRGDLLDEI